MSNFAGFFCTYSSFPLQDFPHQSLFSKTKKELPLVALFHQEKIRLMGKMLSVTIWGMDLAVKKLYLTNQW